jgi:serine/threonine protein phosphatase PrpC
VVGCTVAALLAHRSHCIGLWAGDSRIYRLRGGLLEKITRDHSEAEEARDSGRTQGAADESVITRAVGASDTLFLDLEAHELQHGDRFLICSDGLYRELVDDELRELLARGSCEQACSALLDAALRRQCTDNATAVVVEFADARR